MDLVLDIYDDPTASLLRRRLGGNELPEKLASSSLLDAEELQQVPDRLFAMVARNDGATLRKFAMHDGPHLATSIAYFLETGTVLPQQMQQKVAANLVNACAWYAATPPDKLVKIALMGAINAGLNLMAVPGKLREEGAKSRSAMDSFRAAQASGTKVATGRTVDVSKEEERSIATSDNPDSSHAWRDLEKYFSGEKSLKEQNDDFNGEYPNMFDGKVASTTGTELGVQGGLKSDPRGATPAARMAVAPKTSSWQHAGDLTGHKVAVRHKVAVAKHYALPHASQYPIDDASQVKKAAAYFEENFREFTDLDRRVFAVSVAQRSEELGIKVAGRFQKYAGSDYGSFIEPELMGRIAAFEGTAKTAAYEVLLQNRGSIPAPVMVEMLKKADAETGVDAAYGRAVTGFREPYLAVFEKAAGGMDADYGPQYSWTGRGHHVSQETLYLYSVKSPELDQLLGAGFSLKFQRDPVAAFKATSDEEKVLLSRLANAEASRTP